MQIERSKHPSSKPSPGGPWTMVALLLAACLCAAPLTAQKAEGDPEERFFDSVEVSVVNVEVMVTDKNGQAVTDLGPGDFELEVGGKPMPISNFFAAVDGVPRTAASLEQLAVDAVEPSPSEQRLHLVLFIDNWNLRPQNRNAVFGALRDFLREGLRQGDRIMLTTFSGELEVRRPFTQMPESLLPAIDELEKDAGLGNELEGELALILEGLSDFPAGGGGGTFDNGPDEGQLAEDALQSIRFYGQRALQRSRRSLGALAQLIEGLSGLPGRKALLYVSDGLAARPTDALLRAWEERFGGLGGSSGDLSIQIEGQDFELTKDLQRLTKLANQNRVMMHTLDAARLRGTAAAAAGGMSSRAERYWTNETASLENASLQESLRVMAEDTGGRSLLGKTNLGEALAAVAQDCDTYYSLGFNAPPSKDKDKDFKRIDVKVARKGLLVRHRGGFVNKDANQRAAEAALATALHRLDDNPLGIRLETGESKAVEDGVFEVDVVVQIPLGQLVLVPQAEDHQGKVSVYLVATDDQGRTSPVQRVAFPVRIPNDKLFTALGQHISYSFKLNLRGGHQTVAVGVRDEVAATTATASLDLQVPGEPG